MLKDLPTYRVSIDSEYAEPEQDLGIDLISNVSSPAIKIKGVAFSSHDQKKLSFKDDLKYRIAAPVMVPGDVYRNDEEEYYLTFETEDIEKIAQKFMSTLGKQLVFNVDHSNEMTDSYILEAILVDSQNKVDMILNEYGIELPLGSFFIVQQFNSKDEYFKIVNSGKTGLSLEGYLGMYIEKQKLTENKPKNKLKKMKRKFIATKRVYQSISKKKFEEAAENEDLVLITEELKEGEEVKVIEDIEDGVQEDFTGEVDVVTEDQEEISLVIEEGVITEVIEAEEPETEEEETPASEQELEDEDEEEDKEELEDEEEAEDVDSTDPVIEGILDSIAEIKAEIAEIKSMLTIPETEEELAPYFQTMSKVLSKIG